MRIVGVGINKKRMVEYRTVESRQEVGGNGARYKDDVCKRPGRGSLYAQAGRERGVALNPRQEAETIQSQQEYAERIYRKQKKGSATTSSRDMGNLDKAPPGAPSPVALAAAAIRFRRASFRRAARTGTVLIAQVDEALQGKPL